MQNLLDQTVRSCVITSGFIGLDDVFPNWDGTWPYLLRATYRAGHSWDNIAKFMLEMRDSHNAWISFHTNITDVNVGLREHPEMLAFFERLQAADALFTRDGNGCGVPGKGPAYIPRTIPVDKSRMPYVKPGEAADIFAIVNYRKFWDSGLAKEMIDRFFANLAYRPPVLYLDVLSTTGNNLTAGLPDGLLGGSEATQVEGRRAILDYIRSKGTEPGGESPSSWTRYNWNHGGMSMNDYSRIETGWAQGCMAWRGAEWQHVYGNLGAYTLDLDGSLIRRTLLFEEVEGGGAIMTGMSDSAAGSSYSETAEFRTLEQLVEGFYLTAIQELYHIGKGNVRLPGGDGINRLDEHRGRIRPDRFDIYTAVKEWLVGVQASEGKLSAPCRIEPDLHATNGFVVGRLEESLSGACTVTVEVSPEKAGSGFVVIRYISVAGGTAEVVLNGLSLGELDFPATSNSSIFGDRAIPVNLRAGANTITLRKGSIHAAWNDGTEARWDLHGFRAWNGDVVFGSGYDRMWPDTWSGQKKIYFYSRAGTSRTWILPEDWREYQTVTLHALTSDGRGSAETLTVTQGLISPKLSRQVPYILIESEKGE